jgi:uncharacterized protein YjdB
MNSSLLRAKPPKGGDAELRGYRGTRRHASRAASVDLKSSVAARVVMRGAAGEAPMRIRQHLQRIALLTAFLLSACHLLPRDWTGPDGAPISQVFVAPDAVMLDPSERFQFGAFGRTTAGDSVSVSVVWTATAGTITQTGLYAADTSENDVDVSATLIAADQSGTLAGTARVRKRRVVAIVLTPVSVTLLAGSTQQFSAVGVRNTGDTVPVSVTYSATGGAITNGGLFTAGSSAGTYRVIATRPRGPLADTSAVTITSVPVASVTVTPASAGVTVGGTRQLAATARDAAGNVLNGRSITWTSTDPTVATVSATGLVRGVAVGNATITAASEGQSGTAAITVSFVPVATVTVAPSSTSLFVGGTAQLSATLKDSAGGVLTGRSVTWTSSAAGVAAVSASGMVTGASAGSATITASSEGKNGTAAITVRQASARAGFYASPTGTSGGDGSSARPWDLATALRGGGGRVQPGDTIWLRGGTYRGAFTSSLNGTAAAPIVVRQYPGERATIDVNGWTSDALLVTGAYGVYWGFEIMNTSPDRTTVTPQRPHGVVNDGPHNKYINLVVHDNGIAFYNYSSASDVEIYGCLVYNNGWQAAKGSGHALYIKSDVGPIYLRDNILFSQFAYGVHVYTNAGSGQLNNIHVEGNVSFNNGTISTAGPAAVGANLLMGGQEPIRNSTMIGNMTYFSPGYGQYNVDLGFQSTLNADLLVQGNYVVGGRRLFEVLYWQALTVSGNTLIGPERHVVLNDPSTSGQQWSNDTYHRDPSALAWQYAGRDYSLSGWKAATGLGSTDQAVMNLPTATRVFVRPNLYEPGRATVVIYNWGGQSAVSVDLSGVLGVGQRYEVRNAQDFFGAPVATGTFGGGTLSVPLGGVTPPAVIGGSPTAPLKTGPAFDVFIVTTVAG